MKFFVQKKQKTKAALIAGKKSRFYFWMGFLIPALVTFAGFALNGVWPFGDGQC